MLAVMPIGRRQLIDRLEAEFLAPGRLEEFAASFLKAQHPSRFATVHRRGANIHGQTIHGWPDLYALTSQGGLDAVSVTRSATAPAAVAHLRLDIAKVAAAGPLDGFTFFAWAPTPQGPELRDAAKRLIALGVRGDRITFIFQQELVQALLTDGVYRRLLLDELGLSSHVFPFDDENSRDLFGPEPDLFRPSRAEYDGGFVHRPAKFAEVHMRLVREQFCVLEGVGASGKTVLATHIALAGPWRHFLYLDLAQEERSAALPQALDVMSRVSSSDTLLVVDNVHLAPRAALALYDHWRGLSAGTPLLLVGRLTMAMSSRTARDSLIGFHRQAIVLRAEPADLGGIAARLLRRERLDTPLSRATLTAWEKTFGGDLVAFSIAFQGRLEQGGRFALSSPASLTHADAVDHVHRHCFSPASSTERANLLTIAALARHEVSTPPDVLLECGEVPHNARHGIVVRTRDGAVGGHHLTLVHAGLGALIGRAAGLTDEQLDALALTAARRSVPLALVLLRRCRRSLQREAHAALEEAWRADKSLLATCRTTPVRSLVGLLPNLLRQTTCTAQDLDAALAAQARVLLEAAATTNLDELGALVALMRRSPRAEALADAIEAVGPAFESMVMDAAAEGAFHVVASLLSAGHVTGRRGRGAPPHPLRAASVRAERVLCTHEGCDAIASGIGRAWPGHLSYLLQVTEGQPAAQAAFLSALRRKHATRGFFEMLCGPGRGSAAPLLARLARVDRAFLVGALRGLTDAEVGVLAESQCGGRVDDLLSIVATLTHVVPEQAAKLVAWLDSTAGQAAMREALINSPADALVTFVESADVLGPGGTAALEYLESRAAIAQLAARAGRSNTIDLLRLAAIWEPGRAVVQAVDTDVWRRQVTGRRPDSWGAFVNATRALVSFGRPDLIASLATGVVDRATTRQWGAAHLAPVTTVLRFAEDRSADQKLDFLNRVLPRHWLATQYQVSSPGAVAGALFSVWASQPSALLTWFSIEALTGRVAAESASLGRGPETQFVFAQLYGVASLLVEVPPWQLASNLVGPVVRQAVARDGAGLSQYELQLLAGLFAAADLPTVKTDAEDFVHRAVRNYQSYPLVGRSLFLRPLALDWLSNPEAAGTPESRRARMKACGDLDVALE
jgi:hypothetical protein